MNGIELAAIKQRLAQAQGEHRHVFVANAEKDVAALLAEVEQLRGSLGIITATVSEWRKIEQDMAPLPFAEDCRRAMQKIAARTAVWLTCEQVASEYRAEGQSMIPTVGTKAVDE